MSNKTEAKRDEILGWDILACANIMKESAELIRKAATVEERSAEVCYMMARCFEAIKHCKALLRFDNNISKED